MFDKQCLIVWLGTKVRFVSSNLSLENGKKNPWEVYVSFWRRRLGLRNIQNHPFALMTRTLFLDLLLNVFFFRTKFTNSRMLYAGSRLIRYAISLSRKSRTTRALLKSLSEVTSALRPYKQIYRKCQRRPVACFSRRTPKQADATSRETIFFAKTTRISEKVTKTIQKCNHCISKDTERRQKWNPATVKWLGCQATRVDESSAENFPSRYYGYFVEWRPDAEFWFGCAELWFGGAEVSEKEITYWNSVTNVWQR